MTPIVCSPKVNSFGRRVHADGAALSRSPNAEAPLPYHLRRLLAGLRRHRESRVQSTKIVKVARGQALIEAKEGPFTFVMAMVRTGCRPGPWNRPEGGRFLRFEFYRDRLPLPFGRLVLSRIAFRGAGRDRGTEGRLMLGCWTVALERKLQALTYEYGKPLVGMALGDQRLFSGADSTWETRWEPSEPDATATLWRYMSFAKFCSLLERRELFFSLVGDMEDRYEGFVFPPSPRDQGDPLHQAEQLGSEVLHKIARTALISCWTKADHESALMWEAYAGAEGVAVRATFQDLQESIRSIAEPPVTFGQVEYVDYLQQEVLRFGWAPLFHKRVEYRGEEEVRAVLPGPPLTIVDSKEPEIRLDPDVTEQRGRYIPVDLDILVEEIVVSPRAAPWFAQVVKSVVRRSAVRACVAPSAI